MTDCRLRWVNPDDPTTDLKAAILTLIQNARSKVFVVSFILTDQDILAALIEKNHELRGRVYAITCLDDRRLKEGLDDEDDADRRAIEQQECREQLTQGGVWLRGCGSCHAKYAQADDAIAVVSTSNFDRYPLTEGGEVGLCVTDPEEVQRIGRHFTRLWYDRCEWDLVPGREHTVATRGKQTPPCNVIQPPDDKFPVAIWTDGQEHHILRHLHRIIDSSQKELLLATWDAMDLKAAPEQVTEPLANAIARGVNVRLLARHRNPSAPTRVNMGILADLGISIFGDPNNHAKGAVGDRTFGAIFSANFDTRHGLTSGIEMGVALDSTPALADFGNYLEGRLAVAPTKFVCRPTHRQLDTFLAATGKQPWPLDHHIQLKAASALWNDFCSSLEKEMVLFSSTGTRNAITLATGTRNFVLMREHDQCFVLQENDQGDATRRPAQLLKGMWRRGEGEKPHIGFCPATFTRVS